MPHCPDHTFVWSFAFSSIAEAVCGPACQGVARFSSYELACRNFGGMGSNQFIANLVLSNISLVFDKGKMSRKKQQTHRCSARQRSWPTGYGKPVTL